MRVKVSIIGCVLFSTKPEIKVQKYGAVSVRVLMKCFLPPLIVYWCSIIKWMMKNSQCHKYKETHLKQEITKREKREKRKLGFFFYYCSETRQTCREWGKLKVKLIRHYSKSLKIYGFQQSYRTRLRRAKCTAKRKRLSRAAIDYAQVQEKLASRVCQAEPAAVFAVNNVPT